MINVIKLFVFVVVALAKQASAFAHDNTFCLRVIKVDDNNFDGDDNLVPLSLQPHPPKPNFCMRG